MNFDWRGELRELRAFLAAPRPVPQGDRVAPGMLMHATLNATPLLLMTIWPGV